MVQAIGKRPVHFACAQNAKSRRPRSSGVYGVRLEQISGMSDPLGRSLDAFAVDPPSLSAMRHDCVAVVVVLDDIDFGAYWQPNGAVPAELPAFRRQ